MLCDADKGSLKYYIKLNVLHSVTQESMKKIKSETARLDTGPCIQLLAYPRLIMLKVTVAASRLNTPHDHTTPRPHDPTTQWP